MVRRIHKRLAHEKILIIGGSDAGISAALRARELDGSSDVTIVTTDRYPNFSICGLQFNSETITAVDLLYLHSYVEHNASIGR